MPATSTATKRLAIFDRLLQGRRYRWSKRNGGKILSSSRQRLVSKVAAAPSELSTLKAPSLHSYLGGASRSRLFPSFPIFVSHNVFFPALSFSKTAIEYWCNLHTSPVPGLIQTQNALGKTGCYPTPTQWCRCSIPDQTVPMTLSSSHRCRATLEKSVLKHILGCESSLMWQRDQGHLCLRLAGRSASNLFKSER